MLEFNSETKTCNFFHNIQGNEREVEIETRREENDENEIFQVFLLGHGLALVLKYLMDEMSVSFQAQSLNKYGTNLFD